jgi:hypothetical protein
MQYFKLFENSRFFLTFHGKAAFAKDRSLSCIAKKPELMRLAKNKVREIIYPNDED